MFVLTLLRLPTPLKVETKTKRRDHGALRPCWGVELAMFKAYGWLLPPVGGFDGGKGSVDAAVIGDPDEVLDGNCHCPPEVEGTFRASRRLCLSVSPDQSHRP